MQRWERDRERDGEAPMILQQKYNSLMRALEILMNCMGEKITWSHLRSSQQVHVNINIAAHNTVC